MHTPGRSGTATLEIPQLLGAKAAWTCLYSIIQHHLGSLQGPPLHKNCFMLSLHENKFFVFEWEWPCCCRLSTGASLTPQRRGWTGARLDEHGAWTRVVVRRLLLGTGPGPPRLAVGAAACLQQLQGRPEPGEGEADRHPSRATAVGSSSILRGNLDRRHAAAGGPRWLLERKP